MTFLGNANPRRVVEEKAEAEKEKKKEEKKQEEGENPSSFFFFSPRDINQSARQKNKVLNSFYLPF